MVCVCSWVRDGASILMLTQIVNHAVDILNLDAYVNQINQKKIWTVFKMNHRTHLCSVKQKLLWLVEKEKKTLLTECVANFSWTAEKTERGLTHNKCESVMNEPNVKCV